MTEESNYVVYVHTTPTGRQYFGMSKNVKARWTPSQYKGTSLEPYIEQFGWSNIDHKIVCENLTRDEALKLENECICSGRESGTCLNVRRSGHYSKTDAYKEEKRLRDKAYRESNPEKEKARHKSYWDANKDKINERKREKRKRNKGNK